MNGNPLVVFNRYYLRGTVGNMYSDCNASSTVTFDSSNGHMTLSYNYDEFFANDRCNSVISADMVGYSEVNNGNTMSIAFDVRTVSTALAVNMGALSIYQLQQLNFGDTMYFSYKNVNYTLGQYYDPRYPSMAPVFCSTSKTYPALCALVFFNDTFALPVFNHQGANTSEPSYCDCSTGVGHEPACSDFNLLVGFLLYNSPTGVFDMMDLLYGGTVSPQNVSRSAYDAMFAASQSVFTDAYENSSFREMAYNFCMVPGESRSCSILTITAEDTLNTAVNENYYQLWNGSCRNSMSTPYWNSLVETPPTTLTENYFECRNTVFTALSNSIGIATGNTASLSPIAVILVLYLFGMMQYMTGRYVARTYSSEERDDAIQGLAMQLLMMRDRRLPADPNGVLYNLIRELQANSSIDSYTRRKAEPMSALRRLRGRGSVFTTATNQQGDIELGSLAPVAGSSVLSLNSFGDDEDLVPDAGDAASSASGSTRTRPQTALECIRLVDELYADLLKESSGRNFWMAAAASHRLVDIDIEEDTFDQVSMEQLRAAVARLLRLQIRYVIDVMRI